MYFYVLMVIICNVKLEIYINIANMIFVIHGKIEKIQEHHLYFAGT